MARAALARRIIVLTAGAVIFSCGGEVVRLGDEEAGAGVAAGTGGSSGAVGAGAATGAVSGGGASGGVSGASGGVSGASGMDAGPDDAAGAPDSCQPGLVKANEVVWIGDTWIYFPGDQYTRVQDYARNAGALGDGEGYVVLAQPSHFMADVAQQYRSREAGSTKVKVLVMDGGTWDTIIGGGSDASVATAADNFAELLAEVASDGSVEQVIYYLMPELPNIPGVAKLREKVQPACEASVVPCYFLDLQPIWQGHPEYTDGSGIQASQAGARAIADAIWAIMQDNCIAQ